MLLRCILPTSNKFHDNLQRPVSWPQVEWYQNPGEGLFSPWLIVDPDKDDDDGVREENEEANGSPSRVATGK